MLSSSSFRLKDHCDLKCHIQLTTCYPLLNPLAFKLSRVSSFTSVTQYPQHVFGALFAVESLRLLNRDFHTDDVIEAAAQDARLGLGLDWAFHVQQNITAFWIRQNML